MVNKYKMFDEELYNKLGKFLVGMKDDAEILLVYNTEKQEGVPKLYINYYGAITSSYYEKVNCLIWLETESILELKNLF